MSGNTIQVGILYSLTGTMAISETPLLDVSLMAIAQINDRGGCCITKGWCRTLAIANVVKMT